MSRQGFRSLPQVAQNRFCLMEAVRYRFIVRVIHKRRHLHFLIAVPWLDISTEGCKIWLIVGKIRQNGQKEITGLKIDGCMHLLVKINGCSCTHRTKTNQAPILMTALKMSYKISKNTVRRLIWVSIKVHLLQYVIPRSFTHYPKFIAMFGVIISIIR